jgi:N-acetylgalactosamine kinase
VVASGVTDAKALREAYEQAFPGKKAAGLIRAPGRVNLIGEHTDYNGYPVLPMAIDRDFLTAFAPTQDATIEIANTDARFPRRSFQASIPLEPFPQGDWANYVQAAVRGLLQEGGLPDPARGFRAVYSGNIPDSAGLSSSSALVVVSGLVFLTANGTPYNPLALADLLARAERYVGTESGGMDQAISLLGQPGKALRIDFFPLRARPVSLPAGYTFVISHSLVRASKSAAARSQYNLRVVECRLACALAAQAISRTIGRSVTAERLSDLAPEKLGLPAGQADRTAQEILGEHPWSLSDVAAALRVSPDEANGRYCTLRDGSRAPEPVEGFKLGKRYRHVTSEARRVEQAVQALEQGDVQRFGDLMNESHASCRDDYEVSCPELEALVAIARAHGALGARLTGAGFGGSSVNLVALSQTNQFMEAMKREFYAGRIQEKITSEVLFETAAAGGAGPILVEEL